MQRASEFTGTVCRLAIAVHMCNGRCVACANLASVADRAEMLHCGMPQAQKLAAHVRI